MEKITQKYKNLQDSITSHCIIMAGHKNPSELKELRYCETDQALWDTGATNTIISTEIAEELHLTPIKKSAISGIGGLVNSNVYRVNLYFGKKVRFENIEVLASDLEDCHLITGMDLINKGDFAITNKDGETWFSFRIPSQEHLEFD